VTPKRKEERYTAQLPCILTEAEKAQWADEMSQLDADWQEKEDERKEVASKFKGELETLHGNLSRKAREVREGEIREVRCSRIYDYELGDVYELREDTGEELRRRPMEPHERQLDIPPAAGDVH